MKKVLALAGLVVLIAGFGAINAQIDHTHPVYETQIAIVYDGWATEYSLNQTQQAEINELKYEVNPYVPTSTVLPTLTETPVPQITHTQLTNVPTPTQEFKQTPTIEPTATALCYKVNTHKLWVRDEPDGRITGAVWFGQEVEITSIIQGWGKHEAGWSYMLFLKEC